MQVVQEKLFTNVNPLSSPIEAFGNLFMVASNGDIMSLKNQAKNEFRLGGQPSSIALERDMQTIYIADMAHQAIIIRQIGDNKSSDSFDVLVNEYDGQPLLGPNCIINSSNMNSIYFSDSGPFGECSIDNPQGSVFVVDLDTQDSKPVGLAVRCLAHPQGLALSNDEKILFVAETCKNRILRFVLSNQGVYYFSVYHQFSGRYGPTALTISSTELLYVARFEFSQITDLGVISVLNNQGNLVENILMPGCPEITGLCFSQLKPTILYLTENTNGNKLIRVNIPLEEKEDDKKKKEKENYKIK